MTQHLAFVCANRISTTDYTPGEAKGAIAQWASDLANILLDQIEMFEAKGMPFEEKLPLAALSFTLDGKAVDFVVGFESGETEDECQRQT